MEDDQLLRFSRQIMLPQIDLEGQQRLLDSRVLIVGVGGLGSPVALYLGASGVGHLDISDPDSVDLTNLQRQIAHSSERVGMRKVDSAARAMRDLNPDTTITKIPRALSGASLRDAVGRADVVVDATDNLDARRAINRAAFETGTPLVFAAAIRWEGQISVFHPGRPESPCYQCLYGALGEVGQTCSENGVLGPVVGMLGCMQATEAVKLLTGAGEPLIGRILFLDALAMQWRNVRLSRDPGCGVCGARGAAAGR